MYTPHPSDILTQAYTRTPYQGADPEDSRVLFLGTDANFDWGIEGSPIFGQVLNYLENGPRFWRRSGVHHPFLLPGYTGDGKPYHTAFATMGLGSEHADDISFLELLNVPTSKDPSSSAKPRLEADDLNPNHLDFLERVIRGGRSKLVFLPNDVALLMHKSARFSWLPRIAEPYSDSMELWTNIDGTLVLKSFHFSYRWNPKKKQRQLQEMKRLISETLV